MGAITFSIILSKLVMHVTNKDYLDNSIKAEKNLKMADLFFAFYTNNLTL